MSNDVSLEELFNNIVSDKNGTKRDLRFVLYGSDGTKLSTVTKDGRTSLFTASGFTETQTVHIDVQTDSTLIAFMLIDLSNTTTWKHTNTGHINLEYITIQIDPTANFLGEIKVGFLETVDADNGDFHQIIDIDMARKSDLLVEQLNFGSHGFDCQSNHHFGPIIANSTLFQTTGADILGPDGSTSHPSGDGDLCLIVDGDGTNFVDVSITLGYEAVE